MGRKILVVDDETAILASLSGALRDDGYDVATANSGERALEVLGSSEFDIVLLDIWLPGMDGLEVLQKVKSSQPNLAVIMMSGHGTIETAVKATKLGAYDFVEKPLSLDKILVLIKNALAFNELNQENQRLKLAVSSEQVMVGNSAKMIELKEQISTVAPMNSWVLITGENGTGKELVARAIHDNSSRRIKPFIEVNCAAIPEDLIESELFGHEKGAFTGATQMKRGKFDLAHEGTLFLDEIADMSLKTQAKILRILQEQRFERVGGNLTNRVDVRVIAATNKDLASEIQLGRFREDLYYRLNVIPILVPPLRERKEDIPLLSKHYFDFYSRKFSRGIKRLSPAALQALCQYRWPGNVRELKNTVERLSIMIRSDIIEVEDLPLEIRSAAATDMVDPTAQVFLLPDENADAKKLKEAKSDFEREFIIDKLREHDWNVSKTAQTLGIERTHLHRKMKLLKIRSVEKE
jgi:two-component system nitrogen regulation response regulator NtrX